MVASGSFRKDLYYRLNVFPISIPPLKYRKGDIGELASYFLRKKHLELGLHTPPSLSPEAMAQLMAHDWPGNVRELGNAIERALIISTNGDLDFAKILASVVEPGGALQDESLASYDTNLDQAMRRHIQNVMNLVNGRVEGVGGAADLLGVKPSTLRHRMRKLHIPFDRRAKSISG
jgi:transcriptional regulator with GAF, ATPase, and Fis domain